MMPLTQGNKMTLKYVCTAKDKTFVPNEKKYTDFQCNVSEFSSNRKCLIINCMKFLYRRMNFQL